MSEQDNSPQVPEPKKKSGMPFLDHLEEFRWRILKSLVSVIVLAIASFYYSAELFDFIIQPMGDIPLHYTTITGKFYAHLKVSLIVGMLAALPIVFYQLWAFISPGLYKQEKAMALPLVSVATILFLAGAAFCYYLVLPMGIQFLTGFGNDNLEDVITISSYLSFSNLMIIAFGCGFELPVVAYVMARMGIVTAAGLARGRRYAIVAILGVGAIITPPDVFTQMLLAIPVYFLYEISIIVARLSSPKKTEEQS